jgi:hypothetical protein
MRNALDSLPEMLLDRHFIFMGNNDKYSIDPTLDRSRSDYLSVKSRFVGVASGARGSIVEMYRMGGSICFAISRTVC